MDEVRRALDAIEAARRGIGPVCVVAHYREAQRQHQEATRSSSGGTAAQDWREWARSLGLWDGEPEWWRPMRGSWGDVVADLAGAEVCGERVAAGAVWAQVEGVGLPGPVTVTVRVAVCWGSLAPAGERRWGWCRAVRRRPWPGAGGWSAEGQAAAAEELIEEILWCAP